MLTDLRQLIVVVAHYDDETLFCGGLLYKLATAFDCRLHIVVATDVADTNHGSTDEPTRQRMRLDSFDAVCQELGATAAHLRTANYRGQAETRGPVLLHLQKTLGRELKREPPRPPRAVLTHHASGDYGNHMHQLVHFAVRDVWKGPLWTFDVNGEERYRIDVKQKRRLLSYYRDSVVMGEEWDPSTQSAFASWVGERESFSQVQ